MTKLIVAVLVSVILYLTMSVYSYNGRVIRLPDSIASEFSEPAQLTVYGWPIANEFVVASIANPRSRSIVEGIGMMGVDNRLLTYPNWIDEMYFRSTKRMNEFRWLIVSLLVFLNVSTWQFWHKFTVVTINHFLVGMTFAFVLIWTSDCFVTKPFLLLVPISFGISLAIIELVRLPVFVTLWVPRQWNPAKENTRKEKQKEKQGQS